MNINATQPINLMVHTQSIEWADNAEPSASFTHWLTDAISTTNNQLISADTALQELASGQGLSLHETMLNLEEAKLSFQYLEQIRNRLMTAYQEILREQI